jgi:hypothetical protein
MHAYQIYLILMLFKSVQFKFSAMHDCRSGHCLPSALRPEMQERQETSRTISLIAHEDDGHFVINMHAFHNATLLRKILPRHLTAPKPLYVDRKAHHFEIAAGLRVTQTEKRARTAAKAAATRQANKAKKRTREVATVEAEPEPEPEPSHDEGMATSGENTCHGTSKRRRCEDWAGLAIWYHKVHIYH